MELDFDDEDFRERVRQMLRGHAPGQFRFCDDHDSENPTEAPQLPPRVLAAVKNSNLVHYGCLASTEDNPDQGVEMTVKDDGNFWSSTGSPHDVGEEFLLYKLKYPFSLVRAVEVQVYRAAFQGGGPIYPAKQLQIEVGHSPSTMRTVGGPYTMACTDMPQVFLLPPSLDSSAIDDSFYLSMRYVRVFGSACAPQEAVAMRSWIARPLPPPDVLGPACAPPSLAQSMDISGSTSLPSGSQQQVLTTQDTSTCVIELPSWAQRDIVRALCQISENDGRSGGGKWKSEDGPLPAPCCDEGAYARAQPTWLGVGLNEFVGAHGDPHSPGTTGTTAITSNSSHTSTGLFPHAWGVPAHSLYSRRRQRRSSTAGLLEHMLVRGMSRQCRPTCCPGNNSGATEESEYLQQYSLPPIEPLRTTTEVEMAVPSCGLLHSHHSQNGPLRHSVDEHGFLRCIIWERTHEATTAHRSCEGADDSEVQAAKAVPQFSSQHAPLFVRNHLRSCVSDGIQLVGARKRAASSAGMGSPLKAARESSSLDGTCSASEIHSMLFGKVQSVQFIVPLD